MNFSENIADAPTTALNQWERNAGYEPSAIIGHRYIGVDRNLDDNIVHRFAVLVEDENTGEYIIGGMSVWLDESGFMKGDYDGCPIGVYDYMSGAIAKLNSIH